MKPPTTRLLARHFLRRFVDNDLISTRSDRHEALSLIAAGIASSSLFLAIILGMKYSFGMPAPGTIAVTNVDDRFLFAGCAMVVMALVALAAWDSLALDARDTAILGPLPLGAGTLVRAKVSAVLVFVGGAALALNLAPSVIHPTLLLSRLDVNLVPVVRLMGVHAITTIAASLFGFLAVLGLREVIRALLGDRRFTRISGLLQTSLVIPTASALFLLLPASSDVVRTWVLVPDRPIYAEPPLWFVGLGESLAGGVIVDAPRGTMTAPVQERDARSSAVYRAAQPVFADLAVAALWALAIAALIAAAAYVWNARRSPQIIADTSRIGAGPLRARLRRLAAGRHPVAQAGFDLTVSTLTRSRPHRLALAGCAAMALAFGIVMVSEIDMRENAATPAPTAIFALQNLLLGIMLAGFRHALRLPAELRANWMLQLAWSGDERPFLAGVKRAAGLALALPLLAALVPLDVWMMGARTAAVHFVIGALLAAIVIETCMLGMRKLPLACEYVPSGNIKTLGPISVFACAFVTYWFARLERAALSTPTRAAVLIALLAAILIALRVTDWWQRRRRVPVVFDEAPEGILGLQMSE